MKWKINCTFSFFIAAVRGNSKSLYEIPIQLNLSTREDLDFVRERNFALV